MRFYQFVLLVFLGIMSCKKDGLQNVDVSNVDVQFSVERFDVDFYTSNKENLLEIKQKYPYFFPQQITDSISLAKINSKDEQELFAETQKIYKNITPLKEQLTSLFKHVKYHNPKFNSPKVITMLTNIDYDSRVLYADSLLIVSLDVYLGKNHKFYADYPKYIKENNTKNHIVVDAANAIIAKQIIPSNNRSFISKMIEEGKKMYLLDMYLPSISDKEKIGFEANKYDWVLNNEEQIWAYFIEKELLFSTDTNLNQRFLDVAPFSKFYMEHDNLSPGRVGVYIGWQIVRSYMNYNNDVSLQELLNKNATDLFKESKYKPRK
ncbi:gliding motility lipoprotein GldB [Polaribacter aestuariivivens]|uniref:Gliding motility lipoprotein GldB n=1 Tax=Polaribacter aestuariivivens TaxID=2304626 RepID=A0A5S3N547_9FLAO|nr:gliding motility lipoprotein GldB [Polaribacter aestuariivivens]TMM29634.1 gliding motility lipoprotein GldB [Polaribacter aestuariivivens]